MKPLFSIVIPAYNAPETYFRQAIESCLKQTFPSLEVIIVDDGTPDTSGKIADEYAVHDPRVKVIHQQNGGGFHRPEYRHRPRLRRICHVRRCR